MRPTARSERRWAARGFTLVESVLVIALTGVLAATISLFIVQPVQAYIASSARAALVDQADLALRRIERDLRRALPNSTRVSADGLALELVPVRSAARFVTEGSNRLDFTAADTSFDVLGPPLELDSAQTLAFYNLGPGVVGSDVYAPNGSAAEQAVSNRRSASNAAGSSTRITISSSAALPAAANSPPFRVMAVDNPVSYRCDLASGTLWRHSGYGFLASQPLPPTLGQAAVLATGVRACRFSADGSLVAARASLVSLALTLGTAASGAEERISLYHAVYVDNLP